MYRVLLGHDGVTGNLCRDSLLHSEKWGQYWTGMILVSAGYTRAEYHTRKEWL